MKSLLKLSTVFLLIGASLPTAACLTPQPTRYENTTTRLNIPRAPANFKKIKIALINFRDLTNRAYLVKPATAQLTSMMVESGYFEVIEPSLVENIIKSQSDVTPEKLNTIRQKFGAQYFLTGTLTNFEIRENRSGTCLFILGGTNKEEYIVEAGIDFRMVTVPEAKIAKAGVVENRRVDTSSSARVLLFGGGTSVRVLQSNSGKLLRYVLRDLLKRITTDLPS